MTNDPKNQTMFKAADTSKSIHLSASAGSGKTRALKDRYLALLDVLDRHGLNIDQAVAITFTDKAAAEIKERVMRDLPEATLKMIIRGRQDLRISTIHSFCMNLLKRYPLEAGLPPDFGVLDSRDQADKIQQVIERSIEELDRIPGIMKPLGSFTIDELGATIDFLISIRSRLKRMEIDAGGPEGLIASVRRGMDLDVSEAGIQSLISSDEWRSSFRQMAHLLQAQCDFYDECRGEEHLRLSEAKDPESALKIAQSLESIYFNKDGSPSKRAYITKNKFTGKDRDAYEKAFFAIQVLLYRLRNAYLRVRAGQEAISMLRLYLRAEELYQQSKLREGLLDFDDLEIYAYRLLQNTESPDILYWLDRKILHFLVDEFQDTSDIQWAILDKLTAEIFSGQGTEKRLPPTLFVVGDEKQSIYRFREANYRLIEIVRQRMERNLLPESREILTLERNFRSTPEVIGTVNKVFGALWGESYIPSEVERDKHKGSARLIEIQPAGGADLRPAPAEAEVLAREIKNVVADKTQVYERDGDRWKERPAGYDDCAILIQSRTKLKEYETALRLAGVPYRVVGGIGFYEEDEIQAVMNILFFLWNRDDRLSLAAALKSDLFGLTDKDIFDLMQESGGMLNALQKLRPGAWELLHGWRMNAGLAPLASLIHSIIKDTGAYIRYGRRNPQTIFNIDKLIDTAREFDRRGYTTLQDFVEWVKNISRTEQREATADMNLPGFQGSVSILTVHKAKGLEYPIVFLPGLNQAARSVTTGPNALVSEMGNARRVAIKDPDNPVYEDMWKGEDGEQEELRREHQRLLYVAMTRARDHLIMIGTCPNGKSPVKQNAWLDYLHKTLLLLAETSDEAGPLILEYSYPEWRPQGMIMAPQAEQSSTRAGQKQIEVNAQTVLENISPLPRSTALEWNKATDFIEQDKEASLDSIPIQTATRTVSPLTRGSVLHRCLEEYTKKGAYEVARIIPEYPDIMTFENEAIQQFIDDADAILSAILMNNDLTWIFEQQPHAYSELPFLYKRGKSLISGIIDRVVIKEGKGYVIDYKAILIENEDSLASWMDHYRPQIQVYCEAVKEIFKLKSVEGYLLFLDSNRLERTV